MPQGSSLANSAEEAVDGADIHEKTSNTPGQSERSTAQAQQSPDAQKQPSKLKQLWTKIGLDSITLAMMLKGSLPPTIAIAMYQSTAVATHFGNLGYLIAITSILGFCIMYVCWIISYRLNYLEVQ